MVVCVWKLIFIANLKFIWQYCNKIFRTVHPECDPILIPPGDNHYPEFNITTGKQICFPFMRSLPGQQHLGPREQINQNSAFLDGSMVKTDLETFWCSLIKTIQGGTPIRNSRDWYLVNFNYRNLKNLPKSI